MHSSTQMSRQALFGWKGGNHFINRSIATSYWMHPVSRSWVSFHPLKNPMREMLLLSPFHRWELKPRTQEICPKFYMHDLFLIFTTVHSISDMGKLRPGNWNNLPESYRKSKVGRRLINCWWECKIVQPLWKTVWLFLKRLDTVSSCHLAIPFPGVYPKMENTCPHKNVYAGFTAALLITTKHRDNPNVQKLMNG